MWSYPALLYCGLVLGVVAGNIAAHAAGLDTLRAYVATLVLIPAALAGARLLHVAEHWRYYKRYPRRIWDRREGGQAMYGGLFVALLLSMVLLPALALPFGAFWDVTVFTLLVGMVFARIGCLLNGCCAGRPSTRWGAHLPNHLGVWTKRVPTQCLEAVLAAVLLFVAVVVWPRMPFPGALFLLITASYAVVRMPLESAREGAPSASRLTPYHALSLLMIVASLVALAVLWPR